MRSHLPPVLLPSALSVHKAAPDFRGSDVFGHLQTQAAVLYWEADDKVYYNCYDSDSVRLNFFFLWDKIKPNTTLPPPFRLNIKVQGAGWGKQGAFFLFSVASVPWFLGILAPPPLPSQARPRSPLYSANLAAHQSLKVCLLEFRHSSFSFPFVLLKSKEYQELEGGRTGQSLFLSLFPSF